MKEKFEVAILLPDIHYPEHSVESIDLVKQVIADIQPNYVVYQGDQLDLAVISHWNKDKKRKVELKRLKEDYVGFDKEIMTPIEKITNRKTKFVWVIGNHEDWVQQYLDKNPELEGIIEPEVCLNLKKRGYEIVPLNGHYKLGKLSVIHGLYTNKYHAAKTSEVFSKSVCYGHTHAPQTHSNVKAMDVTDYHAAYGLGCLCNLSPSYMKNRPSAWIHGFGVVYIFPNGNFNLYPVIIADNKFIYNGKVYESKKKTTMRSV